MSKLMYEIELGGNNGSPTYLYIETDDDIDISTGILDQVTHITTIDTDMGLEPDLMVRREE